MATQRFGGGALRCSSAADPRRCSVCALQYPDCAVFHHMETSVHSVTLPPAPELCETTSGRHSENSGRNSESSNSCEGFCFACYPQCISLALWRQHSRGPRTSLPMFKPEVLSFLSFLVFCKRLRAMACAPEDCVNRWTQNGARHVTVCVGYHLSPSLLNYRVPCLSAVTMHGLWDSTRKV